MHTHDQFLATIIAHPEADAPRLVYSDWLDEQGDRDRAEFILVQCELARMSQGEPVVSGDGWDRQSPLAPPDLFRKIRLQQRESEILAAHAREWVLGQKCDRCGGKGLREFGDALPFVTCRYCSGSGNIGGVPEVARRLMGRECTRCRGRGEYYGNVTGQRIVQREDMLQCEDCYGIGRTDCFRRGFPVIRCTAAEWCGGEFMGPIGAWDGHGPAIVAATPLSWIKFTDLKPFRYKYGFAWNIFEGQYERLFILRPADPGFLPTCFINFLRGGKRIKRSHNTWRWWRTEADANSALFLAALQYALKQNKQSLLTPSAAS